RTVPAGELIFANVLDVRQRAAEGDLADDLVYTVAPGARTFPFAVIRDWKTPTGTIAEEVQLIAPSGEVAHRVGPKPTFMYGSMDLTRVEDIVDDGAFDEPGVHVAALLLAGAVLRRA